jgi:hypothetical protein
LSFKAPVTGIYRGDNRPLRRRVDHPAPLPVSCRAPKDSSSRRSSAANSSVPPGAAFCSGLAIDANMLFNPCPSF